MTASVRRKKVRLELDRNDLVSLIWALESCIEDYKYDGGLVLAENEMRLCEWLQERLRKFDRGTR